MREMREKKNDVAKREERETAVGRENKNKTTRGNKQRPQQMNETEKKS